LSRSNLFAVTLADFTTVPIFVSGVGEKGPANVDFGMNTVASVCFRSPSTDVVEIAVSNDELFNDIPLSESALGDLKNAIILYIESELNQTTEIFSFAVSVCDA
jgi:hypothetical protein